MFTDKNTESSETIMNTVKSLMAYVRQDEQTQMREAGNVFNRNGKRTKESEEIRGKYVMQCAGLYESFYYRYTTLFYAIIDDPDGFDLEKLKAFLRMKDKVEVTKEISHEDASKKIGEEEYEKYVKPLVEESSSSSS